MRNASHHVLSSQQAAGGPWLSLPQYFTRSDDLLAYHKGTLKPIPLTDTKLGLRAWNNDSKDTVWVIVSAIISTLTLALWCSPKILKNVSLPLLKSTLCDLFLAQIIIKRKGHKQRKYHPDRELGWKTYVSTYPLLMVCCQMRLKCPLNPVLWENTVLLLHGLDICFLSALSSCHPYCSSWKVSLVQVFTEGDIQLWTVSSREHALAVFSVQPCNVSTRMRAND